MAFVLRVDERFTLEATPVDDQDKPVAVDGKLTWQLSDDTIATMTVADDGFSARIVPQAAGNTQLSVQADAKIGPEETLIFGTFDVEVLGEEAVRIRLTPGPVEPQD